MSDIVLIPERTFRRTSGVHFADIGVVGSNGLDLVEHESCSVSPPDSKVLGFSFKQWYRHRHQVDYNRCVKGHRLFELFYEGFEFPHWFVMLDESTGALQIPAGCYHRSYSGVDGSLLLNHAVRDLRYDENEEFHPQTCYLAGLTPTSYFNVTPRQVEHFIQTGELL